MSSRLDFGGSAAVCSRGNEMQQEQLSKTSQVKFLDLKVKIVFEFSLYGFRQPQQYCCAVYFYETLDAAIFRRNQ